MRVAFPKRQHTLIALLPTLALFSVPWVRAAPPPLLLHLPFENSLAGADGELPTEASGVTYGDGVVGRGADFGRNNRVYFPADGNLAASEGAITFWIKPRWDGVSEPVHGFLRWGESGGGMLFVKGGEWLRAIFNQWGAAGGPEVGVAATVKEWTADSWHHLAFTWSSTSRILGLSIDGQMAAEERIRDPLPAIAAPTFRLGAEYDGNEADAVLDEWRVYGAPLSATENARDYASALTVSHLDAALPVTAMYPTWELSPVLTAETQIGKRIVPSAAAVWESLDPAVARVTEDGVLVALAPGKATVRATLNGATASLAIRVLAPSRPAEVTPIDPYLSTPAPDAQYDMPVAILRYLPSADGVNLDVAHAPDFWELGPITLDAMKAHLDASDKRTKFALTEGSRFRGYKAQDARPSLGYRVVAYFTVYEPTPPGKVVGETGGYPVYQPDWISILKRFGMEHYVNDLGVREIWVWNYGSDAGFPSFDTTVNKPEYFRGSWESNMSSPTTWDVSNSNRDHTDLPIYNRTYVLYNHNIRRSGGTAGHIHGHQLESILTHVNGEQDGNLELFWKRWVGQDGDGNRITGRCGDAHSPPNTTDAYDYENPTLVWSDIEDWTWDNTGEKREVNADTWGRISYGWPDDPNFPGRVESNYYLYWMQAMPGLANTLACGGDHFMTDWWVFTAEWDAAVARLSPDFGLHAANPWVPPTITRQPGDRTATAGDTVAFTVEAAGQHPLEYQWRRGGKPLADGPRAAGSRSPTLTLSGITSGDQGGYDVLIWDNPALAVSRSAELGVTVGPQDARHALSIAAGLSAGIAGDTACLDVDGEPGVTLRDALQLLRRSSGL